MTYFEDKVVLLTGANGGLGREMARQLEAAGARLILTDIAKQPSEGMPGGLGYISSDLSSGDGCAALATAAAEISPTIDILVNNAGVASAGDFVDVPDASWEAQMAVNLMAPMWLTKLLLPGMLARHSGHVVNISSVGGHIATPKTAAYAATKFGLRGFGTALAGEVQRQGVAVSNVYPFFTRTPIIESRRYGAAAPKAVPGFLISEPEVVVRRSLQGIARRRLHIFPTPSAWLIARTAAAFPNASARLTDLLVLATR